MFCSTTLIEHTLYPAMFKIKSSLIMLNRSIIAVARVSAVLEYIPVKFELISKETVRNTVLCSILAFLFGMKIIVPIMLT